MLETDSSPVWMFISADAELADLAGEAAAGIDRDDAAAVQADAPAVEQRRRAVAVPLLPSGAAAAEVEDAAPFEEEVALLREEEAEARQVDLLLVDLDLREVGVDRDVRRQIGRDAVLARRRPRSPVAESLSRRPVVRERSVVSARSRTA